MKSPSRGLDAPEKSWRRFENQHIGSSKQVEWFPLTILDLLISPRIIYFSLSLGKIGAAILFLFNITHDTCQNKKLRLRLNSPSPNLGLRWSSAIPAFQLHLTNLLGPIAELDRCETTMDETDMESIAQMASLVQEQGHQNEFQPQQQQDSPNGTKRKAEDGGQPQQRSKRNRYISIACNEVGGSMRQFALRNSG